MDESRTAYETSKFVGRKSEQDKVTEYLDTLLTDGTDQNSASVLVFRGARGQGKTWFTRYLQDKVIKDWVNQRSERVKKMHTVFINMDSAETVSPISDQSDSNYSIGRYNYFSPLSETTQIAKSASLLPKTPEAATTRLLFEICGFVGAARALEVGAKNSMWLQQRIVESQHHQHYFVFIFDSIFEAAREHIAEVERSLLAPISSLHNVLLILTGRSRQGTLSDYLWTTPLLRATQQTQLSNLESDDINELLATQVFEQSQQSLSIDDKIAEQVQEFAHGYPLVVLLLGKILNHALSWDDGEAELLRGFRGLHDDINLRAAIRGLSILKSRTKFQQDEILGLGAVISSDVDQIGRKVVLSLRDANVISWEGDGYLLDMSLYSFNHARLHLDPAMDKYRNKLHLEAIKIYKQLQEEAEDGTLFSKEISYHNEEVEQQNKPTQYQSG